MGDDDVIWNANKCELSYLHIHFVKGNTSDLVPRQTRLFCYTELGTEPNLETRSAGLQKGLGFRAPNLIFFC